MPSASPSRVLLVVRCLLLAVAATAAVTGFVWIRGGDAQQGATKVVYGCPMHPEVRATAPSDCPICRMALEPVKGAAPPPAPAHDHGEHHAHGSPHARGPAPAAASARPASPVAEVPHEPVPEGSFSIPASPTFRAFDAVSRVKVHPISLEMRAPASLDSGAAGAALFFLDESELLAPGEEGRFSPTAASPNQPADPVLVRVAPGHQTPWDDRTALVRFELLGSELPPGTTGSVKFATRLRRGLIIKASAIVPSPEGSQVFVVSDDRRTFTRRRVEIGNVIYGLAAVVSGLAPGEHVAAKHTFALDAEWRARKDVSL